MTKELSDLSEIKISGLVVNGSSGIKEKTIFLDAFASGEQWYLNFDDQSINKKSRKKLRRNCERYIKENAEFTNKPVGFIPAVLWWWVAQAIISWIAKRISEYLWDRWVKENYT